MAPARQMRRDRGGNVGERTHRGAEHDAVGTFHGARGVRLHPVGEAQFAHPVERLRGPCVHHDLAGEVAAFASDARDGAADQADPDQRQAFEQRFTHA